MKRRIPVLLSALLLPLAFAAAASAQVAENTITASASSSVHKMAETLRLAATLQADAPTLKEAMTRLQARRDAVKAGLVKMGAVEASFKVVQMSAGDGGGDDQRSQMERMMRARMGNRGPAAATQASKSVTLTCTIRVDWPLTAATPEDLLLASSAIKEQVKASKLLETPKSGAPSEAEEEASESMPQGQMSPNEPNYFFVAKITDAEQAKATAEAFGRAKESAARLARAAGVEMGALRSLSGRSTAENFEDLMQEYGGNSYYEQRMAAMRARGDDPAEAYATEPGEVKRDMRVTVSFAIK